MGRVSRPNAGRREREREHKRTGIKQQFTSGNRSTTAASEGSEREREDVLRSRHFLPPDSFSRSCFSLAAAFTGVEIARTRVESVSDAHPCKEGREGERGCKQTTSVRNPSRRQQATEQPLCLVMCLRHMLRLFAITFPLSLCLSCSLGACTCLPGKKGHKGRE